MDEPGEDRVLFEENGFYALHIGALGVEIYFLRMLIRVSGM